MFGIENVNRFSFYRFQILPINRSGSGLLNDEKDIEELLKNKNKHFKDKLLAAKKLISNKTKVSHKVTYNQKDMVIMQIAANRQIQRETEDFKQEDIDNWPAIMVAIYNDPNVQLLAVQMRTKAFAYPSTPVKIIEETVNHGLSKLGLRAHFEPLFEENVFWDLVRANKTRISKISFELVTPNMANITRDLDDDLKQLAKGTNTAKTQLTLESDPKSVLDISKANKQISSLVNYASNGGGDITLEVKGVRKKIRAQKSVKEIEIDSIVISGSSAAAAKALEKIMKSL